jgi:hypothetical protein
LQRVSFYSVIDVLYHSSTTKPLLSLILYKTPAIKLNGQEL